MLASSMFVNQELEAQVLAALAAAGSGRFYELVDLLPLTAFSVHAPAYAALSDAFAAGKPVPLGALPEAELPAGFNLDAAAAELAALAQKRLVAEALEVAWRDLPTRDATVVIAELQAAAARAEAAVRELAAGQLTFANDAALAGEVLRRAKEALEARKATGRAVVHPATGIPALDRITSGFAPGVWVLLGLPGAGKTFLALDLMLRFLEQPDAAALYVTFEEPPWRFLLKCWCNRARLDWSNYTDGYGDLAALEAAARAFAPTGSRLAVYEANQNVTCAHIRAKASACKAKTRAKHIMVVVDYLQLLANTAAGNVDDPAYQQAVRHRVDAVMAGLRDLANRLEAVVLVISALNRAAYKDPTLMAAARESSNVEYSADVIMRLHTDPDDKPAPGQNWEMELHVLKNRTTGRTGVVPVVAMVKESRFAELTLP